jgi:hypothetical protein
MPFKSKKQMRYLYAKEPAVAEKFVEEAREKHQAMIQPGKKKVRVTVSMDKKK